MTAPLEHHVNFKGSIVYGRPLPSTRRTLAVDDSGLLDEHFLAGAPLIADVVRVERRPDASLVDSLVSRVHAEQAERLIAIGSGALIDAVKLVLQRAESTSERELELVFVPCGAEPYRAVVRFSVVDDERGERPTVLDERFARAEVCIAPSLLDRVPDETIATSVLDSAVHAIESLLSSHSNPLSSALATSALRTFFVGERSDRERLITGSFLAAEAFASTKLGLAHAIASPLGTDLGITHDTINGVLGQTVIEYWDGAVPGFAGIAEACGVSPTAGGLSAAMGEWRIAAELPDSLDELGIGWERVEAILPRAARSSGIALLPRPLPDGGLEAFARRAWQGRIEQEVAHAEPA